MSGQHKKEAEALLKRSPLFAGFGSRELKCVLSMVHERKYDPGQDLYAQGTLGAGLYMVLTGAVSLFEEGAVLPKAELRAGAVFGVEALLGDRPVPRPHTARAAEHCRVLVLLLPELLALGLSKPALAGKVREAVSKIDKTGASCAAQGQPGQCMKETRSEG